MIAILSSAKTLDVSSPWTSPAPTTPEFLDRAVTLAQRLQTHSSKQLRALLDVSDKIAALNAARFQQWRAPHTPDNAKPALLAYRGDVYKGLRATEFTAEDFAFAQRTLRVISGLYGVLRPLDLIQPYRLELAAALNGPSWTDLYAFWSAAVTRAIDRDSDGLIVNLASREYSRVLAPAALKARVLTLTFKQLRGGTPTMIPILAKRARGLAARFLVTRRVTDPERFKAFTDDGYRYAAADSSADEWVFVRRG